MEPHWCEKGHVGYILEGRIEIRFDTVTLIFDRGDGILIPPGKEHRHLARALSDVVRAVFLEES
jgi:mannose-6-phosphate isomerase-like protein (cupin superfamily)